MSLLTGLLALAALFFVLYKFEAGEQAARARSELEHARGARDALLNLPPDRYARNAYYKGYMQTSMMLAQVAQQDAAHNEALKEQDDGK